jgi:hypothetical protein
MQLADGARGKAHVDPGHCFRDREIPDRDLSRPTSVRMPVMNLRKRVSQRAEIAIVGRQRLPIIGIDRFLRRVMRAVVAYGGG